MSTRFTDAEVAEIDTARGSTDRGTWLRQAALAALERQRPPQAVKGNCPHPKARIHKGMCHACGTGIT